MKNDTISIQENGLYGMICDWLPEGMKLSTIPKLPMIETKIDKMTVGVTDLRYLNKDAVNIIEHIICMIVTYGAISEVPLLFDNEMDDKDLRIVLDILQAFSYDVKKKGRDAFSFGGHLFHSFRVLKDEDGNHLVTVLFSKDMSQKIYDYAQKQIVMNEPITLFGIAVALGVSEVEACKKHINEVGL